MDYYPVDFVEEPVKRNSPQRIAVMADGIAKRVEDMYRAQCVTTPDEHTVFVLGDRVWDAVWNYEIVRLQESDHYG